MWHFILAVLVVFYAVSLLWVVLMLIHTHKPLPRRNGYVTFEQGRPEPVCWTWNETKIMQEESGTAIEMTFENCTGVTEEELEKFDDSPWTQLSDEDFEKFNGITEEVINKNNLDGRWN